MLTIAITKILGDDTPALQAVLDADVWRKHLLAELEVSMFDKDSDFALADTVTENKQATG